MNQFIIFSYQLTSTSTGNQNKARAAQYEVEHLINAVEKALMELAGCHKRTFILSSEFRYLIAPTATALPNIQFLSIERYEAMENFADCWLIVLPS